MKKNITIIISIIVLALVAGGSFYGGMVYKSSQAPATGQRTGLGQRGTTAGRFAAGANFISGTVAAKDDQSITIKAADGSSKIVFYSTTTDVGKSVSGTISDVVVGQTVMASGKTNSDGSISATSIQIRPATASPKSAGSN